MTTNTDCSFSSPLVADYPTSLPGVSLDVFCQLSLLFLSLFPSFSSLFSV